MFQPCYSLDPGFRSHPNEVEPDDLRLTADGLATVVAEIQPIPLFLKSPLIDSRRGFIYSGIYSFGRLV